jgi:EpsI family protein
VRITSIVFAAQWGGRVWGDRVHEWMGFIVFAIVLGGLLAAVAALERVKQGRWRMPGSPGSGPSETRPGRTGPGGPAVLGATVAIVVLAAAEFYFLSRLSSLPPRGAAGVRLAADGANPVGLPTFLGTEWIGKEAGVADVEREILPPDTGFSRKTYVALADPSRPVFLSIVLSGRDRTSIHRPELCLVGQGWTIDDTSGHRFAYPATGGGSDFPATVLHVRREVMTPRGRSSVPQLVAYWFVSSDAVVATHWERFLHDAWSRLRHLRADRWAYVLMQTDATDGEAAAFARMQAVLDQTLPAFQPPQAAR